MGRRHFPSAWKTDYTARGATVTKTRATKCESVWRFPPPVGEKKNKKKKAIWDKITKNPYMHFLHVSILSGRNKNPSVFWSRIMQCVPCLRIKGQGIDSHAAEFINGLIFTTGSWKAPLLRHRFEPGNHEGIHDNLRVLSDASWKLLWQGVKWWRKADTRAESQVMNQMLYIPRQHLGEFTRLSHACSMDVCLLSCKYTFFCIFNLDFWLQLYLYSPKSHFIDRISTRSCHVETVVPWGRLWRPRHC